MRNPLVDFINGHMSVGARLAALSGLFCVPILLLTALFIAQSWKEISFVQKEIVGVGYERRAWPLLEAAARGQAAAPADEAAFTAEGQQLDARFGTAEAARALISAPTGQQLAMGVSFVSTLANNTNLALDPDLPSFYMVVPIAFGLPQLLKAEDDLGAAVATPIGQPGRRMRIAEAIQALRSSAAAATDDFGVAMTAERSGRTRAAIEPHARRMADLAARVVADRDALLAGAPAASVTADLAALESETGLSWEAAAVELQRLLTVRTERLTGDLAFNLAVVLLSLVAAGAFGITVAGGIASRTTALVRTLEQLIGGDTSVDIPYIEDTNEGARIAGTFRVFKQRLIENVQAQEEATRRAAAAEEARAATEAERARVTRFLAVGEMASSIAHEINQPIAAVVAGGAAAQRWLASSPPNLERARGTLSRIVRDANRASDVVQRIRAILRRSAPPLSAVDINDAAREALEFVERECGKARVAARLALTPGLPLVKGDRVQLQQVIVNLAMNAIDAMRGAGGQRVLLVSTALAGEEEVLVAVEDTGAGFAPGEAARVFEPFFTTKPNGMGLGLSISRSIVEYHGGKIWAETSAAGGAAFRFTLQSWSVGADGAPAPTRKARRRAVSAA